MKIFYYSIYVLGIVLAGKYLGFLTLMGIALMIVGWNGFNSEKES